MCISQYRKIVEILGLTARMDDGRVVRLGNVTDVKIGDTLEVYADIAVSKVDPKDITIPSETSS